MSAPVELVIEGGPRPHVAQSLRQLWAFRGTILAFAERDCRLKYKQAVLGVAWAMLQPLAFMAIFTVMLGKLAKVPGGSVRLIWGLNGSMSTKRLLSSPICCES